MEREIKFRGKRANGIWKVNKSITQRLSGKILLGGYAVNPYTIGQFTGLKDAKGKDIYEGDMLFDGLNHWLVYFNQNECSFVLEDLENECGQDGVLNTYYAKKAEVVGNKFDNNELLKGVKK